MPKPNDKAIQDIRRLKNRLRRKLETGLPDWPQAHHQLIDLYDFTKDLDNLLFEELLGDNPWNWGSIVEIRAMVVLIVAIRCRLGGHQGSLWSLLLRAQGTLSRHPAPELSGVGPRRQDLQELDRLRSFVRTFAGEEDDDGSPADS